MFIGLVIGIAVSLALTPFLASMLFKVKARDPLVLAGVAVLVTIAAIGASYFPARRAAAVDAMVALREE